MLVSYSKKFIYIKTRKTAGTSVEMALQPYCTPADMIVSERTEALITDEGIVGARRSNISKENWYNHMSAEVLRQKLPFAVWNNYTKICNIRNPWDKSVSFFHMKFPAMKKHDHSTIIKVFREWIVDAEELGVDTEIYFIDGKPIADFYIKYHTMAEDFHALCHKLNLKIDKIPRAKTKPRGENKIPFQTYFDDASKARVASLYAQEIKHFDWTFE